MLPHVDCFLPNEDEARLVTGHDNPADQARALLDWGCASVIITCGADGAVYADPARVLQVRPPSSETFAPPSFDWIMYCEFLGLIQISW